MDDNLINEGRCNVQEMIVVTSVMEEYEAKKRGGVSVCNRRISTIWDGYML